MLTPEEIIFRHPSCFIYSVKLELLGKFYFSRVHFSKMNKNTKLKSLQRNQARFKLKFQKSFEISFHPCSFSQIHFSTNYSLIMCTLFFHGDRAKKYTHRIIKGKNFLVSRSMNKKRNDAE